MDIKDKVSPEDKLILNSLAMQCQVLKNLFNQSNAALDNKASEILARNGLSPQMYALRFNGGKDLWEAVLKEGALIVPNREARRAINKN